MPVSLKSKIFKSQNRSPGFLGRSSPESRLQPRAKEKGTQLKFILKFLFLVFFVAPFVYVIFFLIFDNPLSLLLFPPLIVIIIWVKAIIAGDSFWETLLDNITVFPIKYAEDELRLERRWNATYTLILINVSIHYALVILGNNWHETVIDYLSFFPGKLHLWNFLISPLASNFLHADASHLWWNMIFLYAFGIVLERRIGWRRFTSLYILTGLISSFISGAIPILFLQELEEGIGASGAISGIMGVFAVRLFFKRLVFPVPLGFFSFIFPVYLKIKVNSLFVMAMYFCQNLAGGMLTLSGEVNSEVGYWAHLGGAVAGIILGLRLGYQDKAIEDKCTQKGLAALEDETRVAEGIKLLARALELNPENETALLALARRKSWPQPSEEGLRLYQKFIRLTIEKAPERAAEVFMEYFPRYRVPFEPPLQFSLAETLYRYGWVDAAAHALQVIVDDPSTPVQWAKRSLFKLAKVLEEIGLREAARFRYEQLLERFPEFPEGEYVRYKIKILSCS